MSASTGDSVVRAFYAVAGRHLGFDLTETELRAHDVVVGAVVGGPGGADEGRAAGADEIEAEDAAAEAAKNKAGCGCVIS